MTQGLLPKFTDAPQSLRIGRILAREWAEQIDDRRRQAAAWSFTAETIRSYVEAQGKALGEALEVSPLQLALTYRLDTTAAELAHTLGQAAATLPTLQACYQLSATYTAMLPATLRSAWGAYYTPPALTERLLDLAKEAGIDWATAKVLDPACGGGAFLLPVALRMRQVLQTMEPTAFVDHLATHLKGFELDPFAAWLTQVWLEVTFAPEAKAADRPFPAIVSVCDSLEQPVPDEQAFDLVVGNPPYGRMKLSDEQRQRFKRSLFGHANLYGVFTDLGIRWTRPGGVLAYVTPTSFLAGEYFKSLRALLTKEAPPIAVDFVSARRGVFEDVLQEAMLATYRRAGNERQASVHFLSAIDLDVMTVTKAGTFALPKAPTDPWLVPREPAQEPLVEKLARMSSRLCDWGYGVSTGPLVWNRFKTQLKDETGKDRFPLIWAEAVTADGRFIFRAEKRSHKPYFHAGPADDWLKVSMPCVLLQRTTAKEQQRRLIAAELPASFIAENRAVVVENHLNMIKPLDGKPKVSTAAVAAFFNSAEADQSFRCISGSVAVSAFELEALPIPSVTMMGKIDTLLKTGASGAAVAKAISKFYVADAGK